MKLSGEERRTRILEILKQSDKSVSGSLLAKTLDVSRQVIVTDIALLRTTHPELLATNAGYRIVSSDNDASGVKRIFKVKHTDEQVEEELTAVTDCGGTVVDVFVQHKVYGTIAVPLHISSKRDVLNFVTDLKSGVSTPLKNITHGYHYHTVVARNTDILDEIQSILDEKGFLIEVKESTTVYQAKNYSQI